MLYHIINVTDVMHRKAQSMVSDDPFNGRSIIRDGSNQYCGHLAEIAFGQYLGFMQVNYEYVGDDVYDHDFIIGGQTYDVKAKARNVPCRFNYDAHVNVYQMGFNVDYYVFASVHMEGELAKNCEFMSWMPKDRFWDYCHIAKAGDNSDGLIEKAESGKLKYCDMLSMYALDDKLEGVVKCN